MNNCVEYLDLISAYADDELSESDKNRVEAHLSVCDSCFSTLELYRSISVVVSEARVQAPQSLSLKVMEEISNIGIKQSSAEPRRSKQINILLTRYVPMAACLVLVLLSLPRIFLKNGSVSTAPAPMVSPSESIAVNGPETEKSIQSLFDSDDISAEASAVGQVEQSEPNYNSTAADSSRDFASSPAYPGAGSGLSDSAFNIEPENRQDSRGDTPPAVDGGIAVEAPQMVPQDSATQQAAADADTKESAKSDFVMNPPSAHEYSPEVFTTEQADDAEVYVGEVVLYARIVITGELPAALESYNSISTVDGKERLFEISREVAKELIKEIAEREDVRIVLIDEKSEIAWVIYTAGE